VALVDIGLPVMDGCDLARRIASLSPSTRLVAVTGYGQEADRRRAAQSGFVLHLAKPVEGDLLREAVAGEGRGRERVG